MLANYVAPYDATVTQKLRAAGAVLAGRTNLDEFAMGTTRESSAFQPVRNPLDTALIPGGSSGGSAAAVAGGMALAALGTDTAGSIRQPAALCGCVGFKPSYGLVSRYGVAALASSLDHVGPITKTVEDAAIIMNVIAGADQRDLTSSKAPLPDFRTGLSRASLRGVRIGLPREYFDHPELNPEIRAITEEAARRCAELGAIIEETTLPHTDYIMAAYGILSTAEASANLARYDGVRYGQRAEAESVHHLYAKSRGQGFGLGVKRRLLQGTLMLTREGQETYYRPALKLRTLICRDFALAFERFDALLTPATPTLAWPMGGTAGQPFAVSHDDCFLAAANLAGIPGITLPNSKAQNGLPASVQFMAPAMADARLLRVAHAFEQGL
jgi:aspartyl-tRNA(Asn)/glutamyl-tRNA(Gln) amidotransferase subunit A